ncbi:MAG: diguanylate cyclase [Candidatus Polarisedimenticolaceae bacterium]|nr:diguanylate cyclase [Candidatus Polarisedimenticolaceae bacterium]
MSNKSKTFLSIIQHNIILWFILPGIAFVMLFGIWTAMNRMADFRQTSALLTKTTSQLVLEKTDTSHRLLRALSTQLDRTNGATIQSSLTAFYTLYPHFKRLIWLTRNQLVQNIYPVGVEGVDFPLMIWEGATDNLMLSRPMLSEKTGDVVIYVGHILPSGEILAGELSLGSLENHIHNTFPNGLLTIIADDDGNMVLSTDQQLAGQSDNLQNLGIFESNKIPFFDGFFENRGQLYFGEATKFPRINWLMVVYQPAAALFYPVAKAVSVLLFMLSVFSLFFFLKFRHSLQKFLLTPLKRFVFEIQAAAKGTYRKRRATDRSFDELDIVADEFEKMTLEVLAREKRFRSIFENATDGIYQSTFGGRFLKANPALVRMLGCSSMQNVIDAYPCIPDDLYADPADWKKMLEKLQRNGRVSEFETRLKRDDGGILYAAISAYQVHDDLEDMDYIEGSIADIRERKRAQYALLKHRDNLKEEVKRRTNKLAAIVTELKRRNREAELMAHMRDLLQACNTEQESFDIVASICSQIFPNHAGFVAIKRETMEIAQAVVGFGDYPWEGIQFNLNDCWAVRRGGAHIVADPEAEPSCPQIKGHSRSNLCVPITARSECLGIIHLSCDCSGVEPRLRTPTLKRIESKLKGVTELYALSLANIRLRERLHLQSIIDSLTGLFNRRHMEYALTREFDRATRNDTNVGLMMLDIDHFKQLNDSCGHEVGDKVLWKIGMFLKNSIRGEDIACRYGGEELIVILPGCSPEDCLQKANEIRQGIEQLTVVVKKRELRVTVSIGISSFPQNGELIDEVIRAADDAMYEAKKAGRNCIVSAI